MSRLRFAIVGCSNIAAFHIKALKEMPDAEITALCDINRERLQTCSEKWDIPGKYTDIDTMLADERPDAVCICTPNFAHAEGAVRALDAGAHVLCEKPMACTSADARRMCAAASRNNRLLAVGMVRRFGQDAIKMQEMIRSGMTGDLYHARVSYLRKNGHPGGWFGHKALSGGGSMLDLGIHILDLAWYLMNKPLPLSVSCITQNRLGERKHLSDPKAYKAQSGASDSPCDVDDFSCALFRFQNGSSILLESSYSLNIAEDEQRFQLCGEKAGLSLDPFLTITHEQNGQLINESPEDPVRFDMNEAFLRQIRHFIDCIIKNQRPVNNMEDAVCIMEMLENAYLSAEKGCEIRFSSRI